MDRRRRDFLDRLLTTPSPSGFETRGQRTWLEYVAEFADETQTDDYGNAVAVHEGGDGPHVAFAGHADEIGYIVRRIEEEGFLRIGPIGGADRAVSRGQHVTVHADDGPVQGVVGQTAIHLRKGKEEGEEVPDLPAQYVDVGAADEEEARDLVAVGDPVTVSTTVRDLHGSRIAARGLDNRVGVWAAAEGLRRAAEADVDATVSAVSTVQEEVGRQGARMVGFDLDVDAVVAVDVTHATDHPSLDAAQRGPITLGDGPAVTRGSTNHPELVALARAAAADAELDVQLQATGTATGTDADAFYVARGGTPALYVGIPNRYMHTPVEVVDLDDLDDVATLLGAMAERGADREGFAVEI
ncbi:MAG: M20/M25/M40 family metallo-hydrolase [Haloferacaceae archaeon]